MRARSRAAISRPSRRRRRGLLARKRFESGETVLRFVDDHGGIGEMLLDAAGRLIRSREGGTVFEARVLFEERVGGDRFVCIARHVSGAPVRYAVSFDGQPSDVEALSMVR